MGIFSKISGVDAKLLKYKKRASNVPEIVRLQAKEDGYYADFEAGPASVDRYKKIKNL